MNQRTGIGGATGQDRLRVLHVTCGPPENYCGVKLVMWRHLIAGDPFELLVVTNVDYCTQPLPHVRLRLPYLLHRLQKSRFGPALRRWLLDYENLIWARRPNRQLAEAVARFRPDLLLALADTSLCHLARQVARKHDLPLAGLFLDWFPMMEGHRGHTWTQSWLSRRYRSFYAACDLAFCTSDGMQEVLGRHPNCRVVYPMPGRHRIPHGVLPSPNGRFRLVYVGSVERFYGRMLCSLIRGFGTQSDLELMIVGPNADWPKDVLQQARTRGIYLGYKAPEEAETVLAGASALLVLMSFERDHELFMRTSFTTKFLDYVAFGKPIVLWGPEYCTPVRVVQRHGGAIVVDSAEPARVVEVCHRIRRSAELRANLCQQAQRLHEGLFNPDRLQALLVGGIQELADQHRGSNQHVIHL